MSDMLTFNILVYNTQYLRYPIPICVDLVLETVHIFVGIKVCRAYKLQHAEMKVSYNTCYYRLLWLWDKNIMK